MLLRDIEYRITNLSMVKQEVSLWDTEIITQDPAPKKPDIPKLPDTPIPEEKAGTTQTYTAQYESEVAEGYRFCCCIQILAKAAVGDADMFGEDDILNFDN